MEPRLDEVVLHPSLLIASGIECIDSRDVRFLNAYRKFFGQHKYDHDRMLVLTEKDFHLGGIMNPNDFFVIPEHAFARYQSCYVRFPCLTMRQIFELIYQTRLKSILLKVLQELRDDLANSEEEGKDLFDFHIRKRNNTSLYPKIVALHLCGFGDKLKDAFRLVVEYHHQQAD